jgi:hypothetical protein
MMVRSLPKPMQRKQAERHSETAKDKDGKELLAYYDGGLSKIFGNNVI